MYSLCNLLLIFLILNSPLSNVTSSIIILYCLTNVTAAYCQLFISKTYYHNMIKIINLHIIMNTVTLNYKLSILSIL
jgi:hypothetical protein